MAWTGRPEEISSASSGSRLQTASHLLDRETTNWKRLQVTLAGQRATGIPGLAENFRCPVGPVLIASGIPDPPFQISATLSLQFFTDRHECLLVLFPAARSCKHAGMFHFQFLSTPAAHESFKTALSVRLQKHLFFC